MEDESTCWHIEIDKETFNKLKTEERFWQLIALARSVNALRFVQTALLTHKHEEASLRANRTRYNSFFFSCALLYEALQLVERLGRHYRDVPEFANLHELLKNPVATELRKSSLGPIRNRLAFHFDEDEIGVQLAKTDMVPRFVSGQGKTNEDVYYQLADLCALGVFAGFSLDDPQVLQKVEARIRAATDLALGFINSAEPFIAVVLCSEGWEIGGNAVAASWGE